MPRCNTDVHRGSRRGDGGTDRGMGTNRSIGGGEGIRDALEPSKIFKVHLFEMFSGPLPPIMDLS